MLGNELDQVMQGLVHLVKKLTIDSRNLLKVFKAEQ